MCDWSMLTLSGSGSPYALLDVAPIRDAWPVWPVREKARPGAGASLPRSCEPRHIECSKVVDRLFDVTSTAVIRTELRRDHWVGRGSGSSSAPLPGWDAIAA